MSNTRALCNRPKGGASNEQEGIGQEKNTTDTGDGMNKLFIDKDIE